MKLKKDNDLIWEAFLMENVPAGDDWRPRLPGVPLDVPSSQLRANDAIEAKGQLINDLQTDLNHVLDKIDRAGRQIDEEGILKLVEWFEKQVKLLLGE